MMYKIKASSFLRRTISEPFAKRRYSMNIAGVYNSPCFSRDFTTQLMESPAYIRAVSEISCNTDKSSSPYTWQTDLEGLKSVFFTKLNIILLALPLGILSSFYKWSDTWTFWLNFFALIPLAGLLGNATEELALHTGDLVGGLLNATFGNAVEMIITVQALRANLIEIVQGSLLGSILSNLLLVLGMSFFLGGLFHHVQKFNAQGATCSTSLLLLACLAFIAPTVANSDSASTQDILTISRLVAILIAITYCLFLFFQLGTHLNLFKDELPVISSLDVEMDRDLQEWPCISATTSTMLLLLVTLLVAISSECLIGSIEGVSRTNKIPASFIGVILLPIVGNAAEHATAITVAIKNKPDLTMGVAVGSSTQIAMFMMPFAVLVSWAMDVPMTLVFSKVSATVLAFSILIVIGVVQDGESNWLEGVMLMMAYFIIAIVFYFNKPTTEPAR